jgi:hypothetical protein
MEEQKELAVSVLRKATVCVIFNCLKENMNKIRREVDYRKQMALRNIQK